ncbi:MAG: PhzF family phenazine biosynthesis isomerase [Alphaproteobacteria bacterium]|nr:PhzF family phenazine biosynthesis isomerase [Alphaproteobacteria bacterium]
MTTFPYVTVDVFTAQRFGGNPLGIVLDARGMTGEQMQQVAAEFNYAESTFILPPQNPENTAQVRIFTRAQEVPFAGHPNVGTGFVLAQQPEIFGKIPGDALRFEEKAGLVEIDVVRDGDAVIGARIKAPQPLETGQTMDPAVYAACVSLPTDAIITERHKPTLASVGLPFFVAETDMDSLATAHANLDAFRAAAERYGLADLSGRFSVFVYARRGEGIDALRARMFAPLSNNWEDPATGSASAALGAFLVSLEPQADRAARIVIEQGVEMGRPSEIVVNARKSSGKVDSVTIEGRCVPVMQGTLTL